VIDPAVEQKPLIKSTQATQLARGRSRFDSVDAHVLEERSHFFLSGVEPYAIPAFEELGKDPEVTEICFAGERSQALFYT